MTGFDHLAAVSSRALGSGWFLALNAVLTAAWLIAGPWFDWSEAWQLPAVSGLTVTTWFAALLIQASQNRDTEDIKTMLRELVDDLPDVDERRARRKQANGDE